MRLTFEIFGNELVISLGPVEAEDDAAGQAADHTVSTVAGSHDAAPTAAGEHDGYLIGFRAPGHRTRDDLPSPITRKGGI